MAGSQGIDGTAVVEEQAASLGIFTDAETVFERIKVACCKFSYGQLKVPGQGCDLLFGDVDGSRFAHTALAALPALETNSGVEKIRAALQAALGFPNHGSRLSELKVEFNCNILFT